MRSFRWLLAVVLVASCGDSGNGPIDAPGDTHLGTKCDDGIDNDGDGKTDYPSDPGCILPQADDETDDCPDGPMCPQCANGRDDNDDGLTDYPNDPGCASAADPTEVIENPVACGATLMIKPLPPTGTDMGTLAATSTSQLASPCGGGQGAAAIAYRLDLTQPAVIVATTAGSMFDTVLDLRSADCDNAASEVACNDDVSGTNHTSSITRSLAAGTYFLIVEGADTSELGMYTIAVEKFAGEGTACTDTSQCGPSLVCRTPLNGPAMICTLPQCGDTLDDDNDTKNGYPSDPGCTSPTDNDETDPSPLPACANGLDDDNDGDTDYPDDTACTAASGTSEACNTEQDPIAAITSGTTQGTLVGAHDDHDATCDDDFDGSGVDVLYTLVVPAMRTLTIDTGGSSSDTTLSLLTGTCMEPSLGCDDEGGPTSGSSQLTLSNLAAGGYIVAVDNYSADTSSFPNGPITVHVTGVISPGGSCEPSVTLGGALACPAAFPCEGTAGSLRCRPTLCGDGLDNDTDNKTDFPADPGCTSLEDTDESDTCASGPGPGCPQCADGVDNDGDNLTDANDPQCTVPSGASESCMSADPITPLVLAVTAGSNVGATNDSSTLSCGDTPNTAGDRLYSLQVPALTALTITADTDFDGAVALFAGTCSGTELACGDIPETVSVGALAAGTYFFVVDGWFDTFDEGSYTLTVDGTIAAGQSCESALALSGGLHCGIGAACLGTMGSRTCQVALCSDGLDNDLDGDTDFPFDPGCASASDNDEADPTTAPVCSNGADDDNDQRMDFPADYGCSSAAGTSEIFCAAETNPTSVITMTPTTGTTVGATSNFSAQSCAFLGSSTGPDIALGLHLPVPVTSLVLDLLASSFDTQISLRDTSCTTELGCNEDDEVTDDLQSVLRMGPLAPGNYAVIIDGYGGSSGTYSLAVHGIAAPNALCSSPLFAAGVLACPTGSTCTGAPARCQ